MIHSDEQDRAQRTNTRLVSPAVRDGHLRKIHKPRVAGERNCDHLEFDAGRVDQSLPFRLCIHNEVHQSGEYDGRIDLKVPHREGVATGT